MNAGDGALLLSVLRGDIPSGLSPAQLDPLLNLAAAHGLVGMVNEALARRGAAFPQWEAFANDLEVMARLQLQAAAEIAAALNEHKVEAVFAKGVALSLSVYSRPGVRTFADLDVLVVPESLPSAHAALCELGYAAKTGGPPNPCEVSYVREKLPGFRICVDLHWAFTGDCGLQAAVRVPVADILKRRRIVTGIPIPTDEDALLLAAANLARKSAEPLMLIVDFARLVTRPLDWGSVGECAVRWGLRTPLWLGITLAERLLGAGAPAVVRDTLAPPQWRARRLEGLLAGEKLWLSDKHRLWRYRILFKLLCLDSWWDVLRTGAALPKGVLRKLRLLPSPARRLVRARRD